jgi:inorganic pyrophosphatase
MTAKSCAYQNLTHDKPPNSIRQIGATRLENVAEFFCTYYRNFDGRVVTIKGWRDAHAVQPLLDSCIAAAN